MKNNFCIIMAGGIGSRFWPMSKSSMPKQFLDILGTGRTFIQMTYDRFKKVCPSENFYIVTSVDYKALVLDQLPELSEDQILLEPLRRNTAPCVAYASYKIKSINPEANIIVAPSDHIILKGDEFIAEIQKGIDFAANNDVLVTLGITPSRPETGYGYIQVDGKSKYKDFDNLFKVKTFTEKPNLEMAEIFVSSGEFFWNSGIFIWSLKSILSAFDQYLDGVSSLFRKGEKLYGTNDEVHFINLGTWGSLYENSSKDEFNNSIKGGDVFTYQTENCIVNMPHDKIVVLQGLNGYIVVESDNTLLICKKEDEQQIRQFVSDVKMVKGTEFV